MLKVFDLPLVVEFESLLEFDFCESPHFLSCFSPHAPPAAEKARALLF